MADVFLSSNVKKVLLNKYVVVIGDSVQRSIYKDLVRVLQENKYMSDTQLRCKGDLNFQNDVLIQGGKLDKLHNGPAYREERVYHTDHHLVKFYFVTRCFYAYMESVLDAIHKQCIPPDVVMLNSCLWDLSRTIRGALRLCGVYRHMFDPLHKALGVHVDVITQKETQLGECSGYALKNLTVVNGDREHAFVNNRYGQTGVSKYKENVKKLVEKLKTILPEKCLVIWNTTLPISEKAKGGFLVPEVEYMTSSLHLDILQANYYTSNVMSDAGFDVLDLHFHLRHHIHRRAEDGIHWDMTAHRRMTNLLLTHISEAWGESLPGNIDEYLKTNSVPVAKSMADDKDDKANNNNIPVPADIADRPKAKARRRMCAEKTNDILQSSEAVVSNNMTDSSNDGFKVNNFQNPEVFYSPHVNLPAMVTSNPVERYGGPINIYPYQRSLPPYQMSSQLGSWQQFTALSNPSFMGSNLTSMLPFHTPGGIGNQQHPMFSSYHMMPQNMGNQFW